MMRVLRDFSLALCYAELSFKRSLISHFVHVQIIVGQILEKILVIELFLCLKRDI